MKTPTAVVALLVSLLGWNVSWAKDAERRVALVIGNSQYDHIADLRNPRSDAEDISAKLKVLNFDVYGGYDLSLQASLETVRDFGDAVEGADVALLYYAGHGMQYEGENYIVPSNAHIDSEYAIDLFLLPVSKIVRQMQRASGTLLVFLDACRDNPFQLALNRSAVALSKGLTEVRIGDAPAYVAFSTGPGSVAQDGEGRNSPFAAAFLQYMDRRGVDIESVMKMVKADVARNTRQRQTPWSLSSLKGAFYLNPEPPEPTALNQAVADPPGASGLLSKFTIRVRLGDTPVTRTWMRRSETEWVEIYDESGAEISMSVVKRIRLGKCNGTVVQEDGSMVVEDGEQKGKFAFIPDKDCKDRAFRISHWTDHWAVAGNIDAPE